MTHGKLWGRSVVTDQGKRDPTLSFGAHKLGGAWVDLDLAGITVSGKTEGHLKLGKPRRKQLEMNFSWDAPENLKKKKVN